MHMHTYQVISIQIKIYSNQQSELQCPVTTIIKQAALLAA